MPRELRGTSRGLDGSQWSQGGTTNPSLDGRPKRATAARDPSFKYSGFMSHALRIFALMAASSAAFHVDASPCFAYVGEVCSIDEHFTDFDMPTFDFVSAAMLSASAFSVTITADMGDLVVPKSYRQAMNSPQRDYWKAAIAKEIGGLLGLETWTMVLASDMPAGANLMNCHYIFAVKRKKDRTIEKFKARLVADGNTQKFGVDFDRIFAAVVKTSTIRLVLIIAAERDYNLTSIDIAQAYLQADLHEDLFMRPPPNVYPFDKHKRPLVCKLKRSLYGLKQAGREWSILFSTFLVSWGLVRSSIDPCLYVYEKDGKILWICVYVDDALICDNCTSLRARFIADISKRFPTEDKGELSWILNVGIERDRASRTLSMSQTAYVQDLLNKFGHFLDESLTRRFDSPMEEGLVLDSSDQPVLGSLEHEQMAAHRDAYMSLTGGYLWLSNMTFFSLAYAAGQLARFLTNPGPSHFRACLRVLVYLRDHGDQPLTFAPKSTRSLEVFVDSNWSTRFSISGCLVFYHGCLFLWFSKMQKSVSLSSAEAEYFGGMMAARDVAFTRDLLVDLGIILAGAVVIYSDSKSAIDMTRDPVAFKKTKHILRAAEFLRDLVAREVVVFTHLPGKIMIADVLTKAVSRALFSELLALIRKYASDGVACPALESVPA